MTLLMSIIFLNYEKYTGPPKASRNQVHRVTAASECLNWLFFIQFNDRKTQHQIVNYHKQQEKLQSFKPHQIQKSHFLAPKSRC